MRLRHHPQWKRELEWSIVLLPIHSSHLISCFISLQFSHGILHFIPTPIPPLRSPILVSRWCVCVRSSSRLVLTLLTYHHHYHTVTLSSLRLYVPPFLSFLVSCEHWFRSHANSHSHRSLISFVTLFLLETLSEGRWDRRERIELR